jgi:hypothetical protein
MSDGRTDMRGGQGAPGTHLLTDHRKKLTDEQVNEIRLRYVQGKVRQEDLAKEYGVSQTAISLIVRYKVRWAGPRTKHSGEGASAVVPSRDVAGRP